MLKAPRTYGARTDTDPLTGLPSDSANDLDQYERFGANPDAFTYDARGNMLTDASGTLAGAGGAAVTFTYDSENRLTGVSTAGWPVAQSYDPLGRRAEERCKSEAAENARRARLGAVRRRGESVWTRIETVTERRNGSGHDRAAALLADLKQLAAEPGTAAHSSHRLVAIRERHARKGQFIRWLQGCDARGI